MAFRTPSGTVSSMDRRGFLVDGAVALVRKAEGLYEQAKKEGIPGRSRMGKWDLIRAIRAAR